MLSVAYDIITFFLLKNSWKYTKGLHFVLKFNSLRTKPYTSKIKIEKMMSILGNKLKNSNLCYRFNMWPARVNKQVKECIN